MPLEKAKPGTPGFTRNIKREVAADKPQRQAVAIAYSKARDDCQVTRYLEAVRRGDSDGRI